MRWPPARRSSRTRASSSSTTRARSPGVRPWRGCSRSRDRSAASRTRRCYTSNAGAPALRQPVRLALAQEALEQALVALLVAEDVDDHVLGHEVLAVAELDDPVVVVDRAGLGLDHSLDEGDDVRRAVRRLEVGLLGFEVE